MSAPSSFRPSIKDSGLPGFTPLADISDAIFERATPSMYSMTITLRDTNPFVCRRQEVRRKYKRK